jgi:hypothetical protein
MTLVLYLMDQINPRHHWRDRVRRLLSDHAVPVKAMGFPENWQKRPLWAVVPS